MWALLHDTAMLAAVFWLGACAKTSTPACVGLHTTGAIILNVCVKQDELVLMCLAYRHMGDEC